ncbi:hypothetical protein ACFYYR_00705 [Streptomyces sp. NPDC001922]|uniref:hypothetical protein n=1 Tax=Streptomyces sp. NPDC001922 TaxID=3364624 RepID=UPI0036C3098B
MTVHGERAVIPAARKADAAKALERFTDGYNTAYRKSDPAAAAEVETGALLAMEEPRVKAQRVNSPDGNPGFPPLELTDAQYTIPKQAGWPKFFVADTESNRNDFRWLLVFTRSRASDPWKVSYLSILSKDEVPAFRTDEDGWAEPVAAGSSSGLALAPGRLSSTYTGYLQTGRGGVFADGPATSGQRATRKKLLKTPQFWTDYRDQPAKPPQYAPVALRTEDGGALAFFAAHHAEQRTMAAGSRVGEVKDPTAKALMQGKPERALILSRVSESAARIPARGPVAVLNRLEGVTAARGK